MSAPTSRSSGPIDLQRVRKLFADPARISESDFLRREVAARMHERLALIKVVPQRVLDAGCGSGSDLPLLQERYPQAQVLGLDASAAALQGAQEAQRDASSLLQRALRRLAPRALAGMSAPDLLGADFAHLPFPAAGIDVVWSNLALHWHPQPDLVFAEWRRALRVDGLLMFSCLGPDTFRELRAAFAEVDGLPHTLSFVDMHDFGDMLVNAGFSTPVMDMENITVTYDSTSKLLADVRAWGGNPLATRRRGLLGRAAHARLLAALERTRASDGKLHLTYEVIYGHAFRPAARTTAAGEAIVRLDLRKK